MAPTLKRALALCLSKLARLLPFYIFQPSGAALSWLLRRSFFSLSSYFVHLDLSTVFQSSSFSILTGHICPKESVLGFSMAAHDRLFLYLYRFRLHSFLPFPSHFLISSLFTYFYSFPPVNTVARYWPALQHLFTFCFSALFFAQHSWLLP